MSKVGRRRRRLTERDDGAESGDNGEMTRFGMRPTAKE